MKNNLLLSCDNISYKIHNNTILNGIDFELNVGDIVTIIGPNGGGKTTLAKIIIGIIKPSSGNIIKKKGLKIGYMPQKIHINRLVPITVKDFLFFYGEKQSEIKNVQDILEENEIINILSKQVCNLSGGELQRVLFTRVLLKDPDLLILDEPVQGLDVSGQKNFYAMLDRIRANLKKSIIMISHDLHTVMSSSDQVVCLNQKVHCSGEPTDIKSHESYKGLFKLDTEKIISTYTHKHNHKKNE